MTGEASYYNYKKEDGTVLKDIAWLVPLILSLPLSRVGGSPVPSSLSSDRGRDRDISFFFHLHLGVYLCVDEIDQRSRILMLIFFSSDL
jgi:hypothetical protein